MLKKPFVLAILVSSVCGASGSAGANYHGESTAPVQRNRGDAGFKTRNKLKGCSAQRVAAHWFNEGLITSRYKRKKLTYALDVLVDSGVFPRDVHMRDFLNIRLRDLSSTSASRIAKHDRYFQRLPRKRWRQEQRTGGVGTKGVSVTEMTRQTATRIADTLIAISDARVAAENLHNDLHITQTVTIHSKETQGRFSELVSQGRKIHKKIAALPFLAASVKRKKGPLLTYNEGLEYAQMALLPLPNDIAVPTAIASYSLALSDTAQQLHYSLIHKPSVGTGIKKQVRIASVAEIMKYYYISPAQTVSLPQ